MVIKVIIINLNNQLQINKDCLYVMKINFKQMDFLKIIHHFILVLYLNHLIIKIL